MAGRQRISRYQLKYGMDPYERGHIMYLTQASADRRKPPTYDHHVWSRQLRRGATGRGAGGAGLRIESQRIRRQTYSVTVDPVTNRKQCTCEDYRRNFHPRRDPNYQCKHIYVYRIERNNGRTVRRR